MSVSQTISLLRFPLIVAVVFIHFNLVENGLTIQGRPCFVGMAAWVWYAVEMVSEVVARLSVPLFYVVSGYLFFRSADSFSCHEYIAKLRRRFRSLFIPYVLWNLMAVAWLAFHILLMRLLDAGGEGGVEFRFSFMRLLNTLSYSNATNGFVVYLDQVGTHALSVFPADVPLWFVRDLMIVVLLSPLVRWLILKARVWYVVAVGVVWYVCQAWTTLQAVHGADIPLFNTSAFQVITYTVAALFFFSLGAWLSLRRIDFMSFLTGRRVVLVAIYVAIAVFDLATKTHPLNPCIHNLGIVVGIAAVWAVAARVGQPTTRLTQRVGISAGAVFFIFALHNIVMSDIARVVYTLLPWADHSLLTFLFYILVPLITILLCLVAYRILKTILPSVCNVLTGARVYK